MSDTTTSAPNTDAVNGWNGTVGDHWLANLDRHDAMNRRFTPHLLAAARIESGQQVLDIGCGGGATTLLAAQAAAGGATGSATGIDVSAALVAAARARAVVAEIGNARFVEADSVTHDFAPEAFDVAVSRFGVMFFDDPQAAFANIARALRPRGRLAFLCWQPVRANAFLAVPLGAVAAFAPSPDLGPAGAPGPFSLADPDRVVDLLSAAGFEDVEVEAVAERMWIGSDLDDVVGYYLSSPMGAAMLAGSDPELVSQAVDAMRAALRPFVAEGGVELAGAAWLVTARRS